jgi:hypothetical protein
MPVLISIFPAVPEDGGTYSSSGNLNYAAPMPSLYSTTGMSQTRFFKVMPSLYSTTGMSQTRFF